MARVRTGARENLIIRPDAPVVHLADADPRDVLQVLGANPSLNEGFTRSQWLWVRFPNGDLMLGVFPQSALYESMAL